MPPTIAAIRLTLGCQFLLAGSSLLAQENRIKDLSHEPQAAVEAACGQHDWVACRELGERARYGKGMPQDLAAARRF
jgi:hypothetical protein